MRTPQQIIGADLYKQLVFEGYIVSLLSRRQDGAKGDVLERLDFCVGPWRDYGLVDDIKVEIARLRALAQQAADALSKAHTFLMSRYCHDNDGISWSDSDAMQTAQAIDGAIHAIEKSV